MKYPSYCCQKCGEMIGWLGRIMPFHKCKEKNKMIYKTIEEWNEHNPNHIGALPIEVCRQIWGEKKLDGAYERGFVDGMQMQVQRCVERNVLGTSCKKSEHLVGLTDDEIWGTISRIGTSDSDVNPYTKLADARAIEAKLKEKNT